MNVKRGGDMKKSFAVLFAILIVLMAVVPMMSAPAESVPDILPDNGLPVVNITIDESAEGYGTIKEMNDSPDHSVKCTGTIKITVPDGFTGDYSDTALSDTAVLKLDYIRGRGNTTWMHDKKPYTFKLEKKADLLGMGKNKHWVLLANYMDVTLLRNRIVSYIGSELGLRFTPKMLPVDVVMNGEYLGSYYLSEQVRLGDNRVDIDELTNEDNSEPEITGGYLIGMKPYGDEPELNRFYTDRGVGFLFDTPEFETENPSDEVGTPAQRTYITDYLQKVEDAIYNGDPGKYMDLQSAADYWWVQTFSYNYDAYFTPSTYLYKPRNDKLYWGPLWDFDLSLGKTITQTEGFGVRETPWFDYLRENDDNFRQLLIDRWAVLDDIITDIVRDGGVLDRYMNEIKNSWEANAPFAEDSYAEFDYEMESLRTWMTERKAWINDNLNLLGKVHSTVTFTSDGKTLEQRQVLTGLPLSSLADAPKKDGYLFIGWEYNGEPINQYDLPNIWGDAVITACFLSEDKVIHADNIFFSGYDAWADIGNKMYFTNYTVTPEDAHDKAVTWSLSDSNIAEINQNGVVTMKQVGDVTITATLSSGFSNTYTLHIYDGNVTQQNNPESIILEHPAIMMKVGEYAQVVAYASPQPCETYFSYSGDDSDIIEVLDNGVIRAFAPGTATVTVTLNNLEAICTINVTDSEETPAAEPTEALAEPTTAPGSSFPAQPAADAKSATNETPSSGKDNAAATGEKTVALVLLSVLVAAAGIIMYVSYRKTKVK